MIARLQGVLVEKISPHVVLDVHGVGYEVDVPLSTFYQLPALGESVTLWTHLSVREDAHQLFGFHDRDSLQVFRLLIKISGVGPKLALALLSGMEIDTFRGCIAREDVLMLTKIPGVGKKTAERLVIELRDKIGKLELVQKVTLNAPATPLFIEPASSQEEAESALVALGYKPLEAQKAVKAVLGQHSETSELVRAALKGLLK
ncbi:MAG: Holliday junction branch migration protein RuvA [Pseudomonadota bacterium]